ADLERFQGGDGGLELAVVIGAPAAVAAVGHHGGLDGFQVGVPRRRAQGDRRRDRRVLPVRGWLSGVHGNGVWMGHAHPTGMVSYRWSWSRSPRCSSTSSAFSKDSRLRVSSACSALTLATPGTAPHASSKINARANCPSS